MSLFARRNILAEHKRITQDTQNDQKDETVLPSKYVGEPFTSQVEVTEDQIDVYAGEFDLLVDPGDDIRIGDELIYGGYVHKVREKPEYEYVSDMGIVRVTKVELPK